MNYVEHRLGQELEQRLRFEAFTSELLANCLNTPDACFDSEIENSLSRLAQFLSLDQAILVQWADDPDRPIPTHSWTAPDCKPVSIGSPGHPSWTHQQSLAGQVVQFSNLNDLPPDGRADKAFFRKAGIKGLISVPLSLSGRIVGVLVLANQKTEPAWPNETVHQLKLLASVFASMIERKRRQNSLEERLQYEVLMSDLSLRFINLSASEVDGAIESALWYFCSTLGLDRSALFQFFDQAPGPLLLTHLYESEDDSVLRRSLQKRPDPELHSSAFWLQVDPNQSGAVRVDISVLFPWVYQQVQKGAPIVISDMDELPPEAAADRELFRRFGTQSTVVVPLSTGGKLLGCLYFSSLVQPRKWSEHEVTRFRFVGDIFANALARKRAEDALRDSEERLGLATESAGVGLWSERLESDRAWASPRLREIFRFGSQEELTSHKFFKRIHPEDRRRVFQATQAAIKTGQDLAQEFRLGLPDETVRWIFARGRRHCNSAGKPELFLGALLDITERKRADETLRQSEERLRLVLEANSEGVWDWNIRAGTTFYSRRYCAMLGYEPEEISNDSASWRFLVHPEDLDRVLEALETHIREGNDYCVEFRMRKKHGEWCWLLSRGMVVERDAEGQGVRMVGTHLDITPRKEAEEQALESERRFTLMANSAPVLIWAAGQDKLCTFVNKPWLEFTGRGLEEELGNGWAQGIHADDVNSCLRTYHEAFNARRPFSMEYRLRRHDGEYRWVLDHGNPRYDSQQSFLGYVGSCVDITDRKGAEAEAQRSRQELAHIGRVSTLGELAGSLAHELNQPLTSILSNSQAARRFFNAKPPKLDEVADIIDDIAGEARRAGDIIVRIRGMLKKGGADMLPLDVNLLTGEVLALMHSELLLRNVTVNSELAHDLPLVRGDRVQLQQVLVNLMMNGCEAVTANPEPKHRLTLKTQWVKPGEVKVTVADSGPGFTPQMLEHPFEPFRTTKPHGLGLGLPICRSIIDAHGGRLFLANNGGGGAVVSFTLLTHLGKPS